MTFDFKTATPDTSFTPATGFLFGADGQSELTPAIYSGAVIKAAFIGAGDLSIASGKTLTVSNTLTLTGTDSSSVAFGTGGTVTYTSNKLSVFAATTSAELAGVISDETGTGALVFANSPTFTDDITLGTQQTTQGSIILANTAAGAYATTIKSSNSASAAWTLTLPTTAGTNNYVLKTDGTGVTSWVAQSGGSGTPGGSDTQVQFNDGGAFGGDSVFIWDKTNNRLGVNNSSPSVALEVGTFNTGDSNIKTGSLEFQAYSLNNCWVAENAYYSTGWKYRSTGYASLFYFFTGEGQFRIFDTGTGGNALPSNSTQLKIRYNGSVVFGGDGLAAANDFVGMTAAAITGGLQVGSGKFIGFSSTTDPTASYDISLARGAAGIANLRGSSSTSPAAFNFYTYGASPPSAPSASMALIYADTSGGKIRLMALFPSGAAQQIAIEP